MGFLFYLLKRSEASLCFENKKKSCQIAPETEDWTSAKFFPVEFWISLDFQIFRLNGDKYESRNNLESFPRYSEAMKVFKLSFRYADITFGQFIQILAFIDSID